MLPKIDGLSVLRQLREQHSPSLVLLLTAKDTAQDKINGLEFGADDYLVKPFVFAELLARVKALIRRKYETKSTILQIADLEVDISGRQVRRGGKAIDLSGREYALLEYLAHNAGRIVSRTDIWQHVYDFNASHESNVVDVLHRPAAKENRTPRQSPPHPHPPRAGISPRRNWSTDDPFAAAFACWSIPRWRRP